ncbi:MAG: hypothetical protein PUE95_03470 [Lachnospiraceae bacterium]|nr:hypothetical protein [Lachnospiraceae bacterium]MDD6810686.1 hypothetical protein [Lachnospiraceae bacterium]
MGSKEYEELTGEAFDVIGKLSNFDFRLVQIISFPAIIVSVCVIGFFGNNE